jgi:hypothetical protein
MPAVPRLSVEEFTAVLEEVGSGSPRAAAIVGHALLENVLMRVLLAHMDKFSASQKKKLFGRGPLSMATRIGEARTSGLIGDDLEKDLTTIRKIRNDFAHTGGPITFRDEKVAAKCASLSGMESVKDPRNRYNLAIGQLLARLLSTIGPDEKL